MAPRGGRREWSKAGDHGRCAPLVQPGRVRSHIQGVKEAEFRYDDFRIGAPLADANLVIENGKFAAAVPPR